MAAELITSIIYARVSTEEQTKGYSLQTQEESCRRYCADHGYEIVGAFKDAHSGRELDRPGLTAAIEAVDTLHPDVIVLHDVDRLGREIIVQAIAERDLTRHGARIEYVLGGGNATPEQELLKMVKQGIAVYENRQRVERSRRGKEGRIKDGKPLVAARPAYGYLYLGGNRTGALEPHPDEAPIVQRIFGWCANDGLTTYEIAKRLYADGIPTRGDADGSIVRKKTDHHFWDPSTVSRILRNETHKGVWYWRKTKKVQRGDKRVQVARPREEWLSIQITPIVDEATWDRAQQQLSRNKVQASRNAKREYLLRGLVFCPSCGRRWTGRYKNHLNRAYYRCPTTEGEPWRQDCKARFGLEQQKLETAVLHAVKSFLLDPETRAAGVTAEQERVSVERARLTGDLAAVDRRIADVERRLGALLDQALTGGFPADLIDRRKRDLMAEREARSREREVALARLSDTGLPDIDAAIAELAPTVEQAFEYATPAELRRLLELLRVEVYPVDRTSIRLTGIIAAADGSVLTLSSW
jgi:site-specific DNA recombinase